MRNALLLAAAALLLAACQRAPAPVSFHADGRPEKLSDWHVLESDGQRLTLNNGVLPFDLNSALFSDHAHKLRTVWMPPGRAAHYQAEDTFDFPEGTILSKTFYYPRAEGTALRQTTTAEPGSPGSGLDLSRVRLVETRLLVRRATGWVALPYVWNAEQTEATLERTGGVGLPSPLDTARLPRAADWRDAQAPLADRARAYLDINCAHCHQAQATASNTGLRLDALAPVDRQMGLCKPAVAAGKGTGGRLFGIEPGRPDESIMAFRMASSEGGVMMPELGRSSVHEEGLLLVRQWIASLPGRCQGP